MPWAFTTSIWWTDRRTKVSPGAARGAERWLALHHHRDPLEAIEALRESGVAIYVADLEGDSRGPRSDSGRSARVPVVRS